MAATLASLTTHPSPPVPRAASDRVEAMAPAAFDAEAGANGSSHAAKPAPAAKADAGAAFVLESKGTWWHAGFHLTTAIVGPTVLTLPYALRGMGWALGLTALSVMAAVTFYEYSLMSRVLDHCEARGRRHIRFRELAADVLGSGWMFYFVVTVQTAINTGVSIGAILLAADCLELSVMDGKKYVSLEELEEYNSVVNQTFRTEKEFYEFYNSYAWSKGFSVRKEKLRWKPGTEEVTWRRYCCSCQGYRSLKSFQRTDKKREPKELTRCGCEAKLDVQLSEESALWFVSDFNDAHNHPLAKPQHVFVLRSHRGLSNPQKAEAIELGLGGLRTCQIMDVMDKNYCGPGETGFVLRDLYNFFAREKKKRVEGSDAEYVLNYMRERQKTNSEYYFKYCMDDEGRLKNIFWSDAQSQLDYSAFGDVVVFDSTYRVNRYNLPFVPFIGVDHHRSTVVFGCGIISDESVSSYVWLLEAFLEAMQQKHPLSLITDGDYAMARAIQVVTPTADHRLCSWHIERNMVKFLRGKKLRDFRKFIYHAMEVDEFERQWLEFKETHKVTEKDVWILRMYELRKKWSGTYTKGRRFLGMQSNQRSESLNSRLHNHLDRRMSLVDLVEHYDYCLSCIRRNELELDATASMSIPFTDITADLFEKRAARIFTPTIFLKVREQIRGLSKWEVMEVTGDNGAMRYEVASKCNNEKRILVTCTFDASSMLTCTCHCRMMECEAFPCTHIFSVMRYVHLDTIPSCCVNLRWTMQAKSAFPLDTSSNIQVWSERMERFRGLRNKASLALFHASRTTEETERVMSFFDDIMHAVIDHDDSSAATSFAPLPALFSGASRAVRSNVLDPKKIITKGAPRSNKRWKPHQESFRRN